jgi:hypothetical protein
MDEQVLDYFGEFEESSRIVAVKHFFLESEAHLYAARLREAGIPHYISNANIMTAIPLGGGGGIGLNVRESDLAEASRIVARLDYQKARHSKEENYHDADEEDIEYLRTLNSHSSAWGNYIYWGIIAVVLLLILRAFLRAAGVVESWWDYF